MKPQQRGVFNDLSAGRLHVYPPGGLCLTYVNDLVQGMVLAAERAQRGSVYVLGGNNIKYRDYFNAIADAVRGRRPRIALPRPLLPMLGTMSRAAGRLLRGKAGFDPITARMVGMDLYYSSARAIRELGYSITPWRTAIRQTADHLQGRAACESSQA